ncbi:MAG: hypothetical protein SFU25_00260 [Candidatus Caenarcaniphilales bacterium]|nr:hypothetical protein [Candidatus Caenarcaniphilales bacterium]
MSINSLQRSNDSLIGSKVCQSAKHMAEKKLSDKEKQLKDFRTKESTDSEFAIQGSVNRQRVSKRLLVILPAIALLTETQLAAFGINEERSDKKTTNLGKLVSIIKTFLPFAYKFFGVFDIWHPMIEVLSATAILWNTVDEVEEYGAFSGFLKGAGLHIFSFQVPEWFIPRVQNTISGLFQRHHLFERKFGAGRFLSGAIALILLESCVKLWDSFVIPLLEDGVELLQNNFSKSSIKESTLPLNHSSINKEEPAEEDSEDEVDSDYIFANNNNSLSPLNQALSVPNTVINL